LALKKGCVAMGNCRSAARARVALVTALSFAASPLTPLVSAQAPAPATKAATAPAAGTAAKPAGQPAARPTAAGQAAPVDGGWPRAYQTATGARILAYQPQVASWANQERMVAYAAVSYAASATDKPVLGTLRLEGDTRVALSERLVSFARVKITEANFPTLDKEKTREIVALIDKGIPAEDRVIALDRVLAAIDKSQIMPKNVEGVKADPPAIFYSESPAVVLNLDGDVIWSPIKENDLKFAVNTNWDLFLHEPTKTLYLRNEQSWLKAADVKGPWTAAGTLPGSFKKLPADDNWKDVRGALPGMAIPKGKLPAVFVSTTPAELILVSGTPAYTPVASTALLWLSNTESDVFRLGATGPLFYLVAGRWFSAPDPKGPWTFATPTLPADFRKIPLEHPRSRVLAAVPGTEQAAEAVLLAQVPQTARVNRKELKAPDVAYQGEPKFDPIPPTSVSRAVNTDKDIVKFGDLYYLCFQGVWFMSRSAEGPWEVATSIPKEIYEIPASSPAHSVTYVTVVEDDDGDDWVTFAAVAGYTGMMVAWGCAVWGTGWYYPPYWGYGGYYPYYYPHYPTYGYGAWYNPWTGAYGHRAVAYGPYGGAGVSARYNPRTGTYSRGAAAWGPYGARAAGQAYNPRTGTYAQTRQGAGPYGSWGTTSVQRGDDWAQTARATNRATGNTTRVTRTDDGGGMVTRNTGQGTTRVGRTEGGDVYAGHDGNVYRKDGDSWQKYDGGSWNDVNRPEPTQAQRDQAQQRASDAGAQAKDRSTAASGQTRDRATTPTATTRPSDRSTIDQLNKDYQARSQGSQRTTDYGNYRSSGSSSRGAGSYRPSGGSYRGGGMRGGGGRRR
jgi:hypothetical protein